MFMKTIALTLGSVVAALLLTGCGASGGSSASSSSSASSAASSSASSSSASSGVLALQPLPGRWPAQDYHQASAAIVERSGAADGPCDRGEVDSEAAEDICFVAGVVAGEWLEFETASNSDARYDLSLRLAALAPDREVLVEVDGAEVGSVIAPADGWGHYRSRVIPSVRLTAGQHSVRVTFAGGAVRMNSLELTESSASSGSSSSSSSSGLVGYHPDITRIADIPPEAIAQTPANNWLDSYSVGDRCYCDSTFDHDIGPIRVDTPRGRISVLEACNIIGPGPGRNGRPIYNDIQCGNGPANDAGDEDYCPGRVDLGRAGCVQIGPKWKFD